MSDTVSNTADTVPALTFSDLGLHPLVLKALEAGNYTTPTPIQAAAIPAALAGRDILATAETGTGKTAAFMLPTLTRIRAGDDIPVRRDAAAPRVLVLAPTRELARQVTDAVRKYGKFLRLNTVDVVGGMPYRDQLRMLSRPVDVVVATPGRLIDHVERRRIDLSSVEVLILDEADRMLDMGFLEDVQTIASACQQGRQTLLFTATLDRRMAKLAEQLLRNPERIAVERTATAAKIDQLIHHADDLEHKRRLLMHYAASEEVGKAIVFAATKRDADMLAHELALAGHAAAPLHGDMVQGQRNRTLQRLKNGQVRLLVATDVAARGIDVKDISHVINFDLPRSAEDYVHRIGRTGRAGATGVAISFATRNEREALFRIERLTGGGLQASTVPGLEPQRPIRMERPAGRPGPKRSGPGRPSNRPHGHAPAHGHHGANGSAPAAKPWTRSDRPAASGPKRPAAAAGNGRFPGSAERAPRGRTGNKW